MVVHEDATDLSRRLRGAARFTDIDSVGSDFVAGRGFLLGSLADTKSEVQSVGKQSVDRANVPSSSLCPAAYDTSFVVLECDDGA